MPVNAPDSVTALAAPVTKPANLLTMLPISPPDEDITPKNSPKPEAALPITEPIALTTENIAVKTSLTTGAASDAKALKSCIMSLKPMLMSFKVFDVIGGKISLKASLIGVAKATKPSNPAERPSNSVSLPPASFHPAKSSFRALADSFIAVLITSLIPDHKAVASSKSPIINSQVFAQPEPRTSIAVPIS